MRFTRSTMLASLCALVIVSAVCTGCATGSTNPKAGPLVLTPSEQQVENTRTAAIKIANATTVALGIADQALTFADQLEKQGAIKPAVLASIAKADKTFATVADKALVTLGAVTTQPSLRATAAGLLDALDPLLALLDTSGNDGLKQLAVALRIGVGAVKAYVTSVGGTAYERGSDPVVDRERLAYRGWREAGDRHFADGAGHRAGWLTAHAVGV